jgi:hypothetical protein
MAQKKNDQDRADEQGAVAPVVNEVATPRVSSKGTYQLGGVWYRADGSQITNPKEIQQAHRAMDAAAAEARRKALLGGGE